MFETVKTYVFTRFSFLMQSLRKFIYDDFELDFAVVFGAKFAHILAFGCRGGQCSQLLLKVNFQAIVLV